MFRIRVTETSMFQVKTAEPPVWVQEQEISLGEPDEVIQRVSQAAIAHGLGFKTVEACRKHYKGKTLDLFGDNLSLSKVVHTCLHRDCPCEPLPTFNRCARHEIEYQTAEAAKWKEAWYEIRKVVGQVSWNQYYKGARDQKNDAVYDPEFGKKLGLSA